MLPRFKSLDELFAKAGRRFIQRTVRGDGILQRISKHIIHEGKGTTIRRVDDSLDETEIVSHGAEFILHFDEIENVDLPMILEKLLLLVEQFKKQQVEHLVVTLDEVTEKTGNRHDAKGKPLTAEDLFAMFEKMEINFERNKETGDVVIFSSPKMEPVFRRLQAEIDASADLQKRWEQLLDRKKHDYRTREIDRDLVG